MYLRLKQIGISLCLIASLLVGSASACACPHHQEPKKAEVISCHANEHASASAAETATDGSALDVDCECFVNQPSPVIVSKSESKKSKTSGETTDVAEIFSPKFTSVAAIKSPLHEAFNHFSRSTIIESLLPARAPPRL